jgi:hypothetical protein
MFSDASWLVIDRFGTVFSIAIGLITALSSCYAAYALWRQSRNQKKYQQEIKKNPGNRPVVLIVDVKKATHVASIENQVRAYVERSFKAGEIPEQAIFKAEFDQGGPMQVRHFDEFMAEVRKQVSKSVEYGTDKIHLFIRSPQPVALAVGEYLSNFAAPVIVYHSQNKGYENWGPIHR